MAAEGSWTNQVKNQIIVAGPNGGVFVYDPSPGLGNLIFSATDAAADPFGNATLKGATGYSFSGGVYYAASMGPAVGGASVFGLWTASSAAGPYTFQGGLSADTAGNMTLGAAANLTLNTTAGALRGTRDAVAFAGYLPLVQVDTTTNGAGNDALVHDITTAWPVPANDGVKGTTYVIKTAISVNTGQTTIETLTLGVDIGGTTTAMATLGVAFNGGALNRPYIVGAELALTVDELGTNTPHIYLTAPMADTSTNRLSTTTVDLGGQASAATWNKTVSNTLAIFAQWGGAGGSAQSAQTTSSRFYREGP